VASAATLKIVGDWRSAVGVPLRDVLAVSVDVFGREAGQAANHAVIMMAKSAAAITRVAPKLAKEVPHFRTKYVEVYSRVSRKMVRLYRWQYSTQERWNQARAIRNSGLARRSWSWGLGKLGGRPVSPAIAGTSRVYKWQNAEVAGALKENSLSYITDAMPKDWESTVQLRAGNKIMAQAKAKIEGQWSRSVRSRQRAAGSVIRKVLF
jgi:hypothetical protein